MGDKELSLAEKIEILFGFGQMWGLDTDLDAIANATGASSHNIRKIRSGENDNPGLKTLRAIADYFGVPLAYFDQKTRPQCWNFLNAVKRGLSVDDSVAQVTLRSDLSAEERDEINEALKTIIRYIKRSEGLSDE